jgi:hypothetical protein
MVLGAAVASAVAAGCAIAGLNAGSLVMNGIFHEALPKALVLSNLSGLSNQVMLGAPALGALGGGIIAGIAGKKKPVEHMSSVPGSALAKPPAQHRGVVRGAFDYVGYTWGAVKEQFRDAGEAVHANVNGVGNAGSAKAAACSGAKAGYSFAGRVGSVAGGLMGIAQGAYLGAVLAGMPFAFAPLTAIPVALVGAYALGTVMSKVGEVAAGAVAGAGGAAVGTVGYGVGKLLGHQPSANANGAAARPDDKMHWAGDPVNMGPAS